MKKAKRPESKKRLAPRPRLSERLREARVPLTVCFLSCLVYLRSLWCGFVRDDIPQIVNNRQVKSWDYLPALLGSHLWSQSGPDANVLFYRPLFSVWMLLMYTIGGLTPWFWHLSNILLHTVATYLVFRLCRILSGSDLGAAAGASIFAVHPIHVDAVTWISASCEVLFAIFALAAMLALLEGQADAFPRIWLSAAFFGAGLFAKETGVILLAILPVLAWLKLKDHAADRERIWKATYPYGAITALYLLIRLTVMHRVGVESGEHSWAQVIFSAPSILLFYLGKLFWPRHLSGCYTNHLLASPGALFCLQLAAVLLIVAAFIALAIRFGWVLGLAAALIVIPALPALAVVRIYPQGDITHDRYLYLSSVGLSLLIAIAMKWVWSLGKPAKIAAAVFAITVVSALYLETVLQQRYYQNDFALYSRVVELYPDDAIARDLLGNTYLDQNRSDLALAQFQKAYEIAPDNQKVVLFLARGLFATGRYRDAESLLSRLLQTQDMPAKRRKVTLLSLANVEIGLGNFEYAQKLLQQVENADGSFPELHWAFGVLYQREGLLTQALTEYEREFELTGDSLAQQRSAAIARLISSPQPMAVH